MATKTAEEKQPRSHKQQRPKVLFFSTGDAARSQMAEGIFRRMTGEELEGACTAVRAESSPLAAEVMREIGIDVSEDKPREIREMFQEHFACVITLSDPKKERDPVWPFTRNLYHWRLKIRWKGRGRSKKGRKRCGMYAMRSRKT